MAASKGLAGVERAFCTNKDQPHVRAIHVYNEAHMRAMSSCACWPTTWNGRCGGGWPHCCSNTTTRLQRGPSATIRSNRRRSPSAQSAKPIPGPRQRAIHSFPNLLADLANLVLNGIRLFTRN